MPRMCVIRFTGAETNNNNIIIIIIGIYSIKFNLNLEVQILAYLTIGQYRYGVSKCCVRIITVHVIDTNTKGTEPIVRKIKYLHSV